LCYHTELRLGEIKIQERGYLATAYQAAIQVFEEQFMSFGHTEKARDADINNTKIGYHKGEFTQRFAQDIMFLSILLHEAKENGYSGTANILSKLQRSLDYLHTDLYSTQYWKKSDGSNTSLAYNSPSMGLLLQAMSFVKEYAYNDLTTNTRRSNVDWIYDESLYYLNNTYLTQKIASGCQTGSTFVSAVQGQRICTASNGKPYSSFKANILGVHLGGLALSSVFNPSSTPQDYQFYSRAFEMAQYLRALSFTTNGGNKLQLVGGGNAQGQQVSAGYVSWHAMSLAQFAHATTYTPFNQVPDSMFQREAEAIMNGFKEAYTAMGNTMPEYFNPDYSGRSSDSGLEYLYALAWVAGSQSFINWLDGEVRAKRGTASGTPAIVDTARGLDAEFHRAITGLTAGMLRGLTFS
jgi:hypothetical protein